MYRICGSAGEDLDEVVAGEVTGLGERDQSAESGEKCKFFTIPDPTRRVRPSLAQIRSASRIGREKERERERGLTDFLVSLKKV